MRTNAVSKLSNLINLAGFTVKNLTEFIWLKGMYVSYEDVARYCRASTREYGKPEVWEMIDKFLDKYKIQWDGYDV